LPQALPEALSGASPSHFPAHNKIAGDVFIQSSQPLDCALFQELSRDAKVGGTFFARPPLPPPPPQAVLQHHHHHHLALYRFQREQKEVLQPGRLFSRFFSCRVPSSSFSEEGERARGRALSDLHQKQPNEEIGGAGSTSRGRSSPRLLMRIWVIARSERSKTHSIASRNLRANEFADVRLVEERASVALETSFLNRIDSGELSGPT
jgi:hypothetical protein